MSVTDEYFVHVSTPTALDGQESYDLLSIDLLPTFVVNIAFYFSRSILPGTNWIPQPSLTWIVPGPVDLEKFNSALSNALSVYPLFCGRLIPAHKSTWKVCFP